MHTLLIFLILLAAAITQSTIGHHIAVLGVTPEVVLVLVVCAGLLRGSKEGVLWGLLGGLSLDLMSGAPMGVHMLVMPVVGLVSGLGRSIPLRSRLAAPLLVLAGATVLSAGLTALVLRLAGWPIALDAPTARIVASSLLTNLALMLVVYTVAVQIQTPTRSSDF